MNWCNHLISLFNNVNISWYFFSSCLFLLREKIALLNNSKKALLLFKKFAIRLFVRALHMVIVIIVSWWCWCRFNSQWFQRCYCREKMSIEKKQVSNVEERERKKQQKKTGNWLHFNAVYSIFLWYHFLNRKKGILFVWNRLFYLQVFM